MIIIWDVREKKPINAILAHSSEIFDLDVSSDGKQIVTTSADSFTRIWSLFSFKCIKNLLYDSKIPW